MPPQERVGGDDRRDLAQRLTAYPNDARGEPSPVVIGQPEALPTSCRRKRRFSSIRNLFVDHVTREIEPGLAATVIREQ